MTDGADVTALNGKVSVTASAPAVTSTHATHASRTLTRTETHVPVTTAGTPTPTVAFNSIMYE